MQQKAPQEARGTSPWVWVGVGCCGCLGLAMIAAVALGWWGYTALRGVVEVMEDPEARAAQVQTILGAEKLPAGYHGAMGLDMWVADVAILSDKDVEWERQGEDSLDIEPKDDDLGDRVFIYFSVWSFFSDASDVDDFFEGRASPMVKFDGEDIRVRSLELLQEGEIEVRGVPVRYRIDRGSLRGVDDQNRLIARLHFRCPESSRQHMALWYTPLEDAEPEPGEPAIPSDEPAVRDFLGHFDVCR